MSKLDDLRKRHGASEISRPGPNAPWHEEQSYGARVQAEYDLARAAAPADIQYMLAELEAAHELLKRMWREADNWHGDCYTTEARQDVYYQIQRCLRGEAGEGKK